MVLIACVCVCVCAMYFSVLQTRFADVALFFYDTCGGDVIGVVWKEEAMAATPFKVGHLSVVLVWCAPFFVH